jgi:hypothetical protein
MWESPRTSPDGAPARKLDPIFGGWKSAAAIVGLPVKDLKIRRAPAERPYDMRQQY